MEALLSIEGLRVDFDAGRQAAYRALDGVSLALGSGEAVGLLGESGSGKTVLSLAILGLLPANARVSAGRIRWRGRELQGLPDEEIRPLRGKEIAMIFQDPQASLNPVYPVGRQIGWVLKLHRGLGGAELKEETLRLLESVGLREPRRVAGAYPHELSGGMSQRVMISMALACQPQLLIADEPTSALDVKTQGGIIDLLIQVRQERELAMLFISHDLRTVRELCSQVVVMSGGVASPKHRLTEGGGGIGLDGLENLLHAAGVSSPKSADTIECAGGP